MLRRIARLAACGLIGLSLASAGAAAPPGSSDSTETRDREGLSDGDRSAQPASGRELKSPLLRGLQQTIGELDAFEESGTAGTLTDQLQQADLILSAARAQNRQALESINRQHRVGRARQSPNLLLITIDRLGWRELSCYGQDRIQTPQIDELAEQGLRMNRFYAGSADAQAARWTLLNGLNTGHAPRERSPRFRLHDADRALAEWLWDAGYVTGYFGLWPNGDLPTQHGYEDWSGFLNTAEMANGFPEAIHIDGARISVLANRDGSQQVPLNRLMVSELHSWLADVRPQGRQFFAHVALPVLPRSSAEADTQDESFESRRAAVEQLDELVGQLLDVLSASGLKDRTCVILTAESGPAPTHRDVVQALNLTGELAHASHGLGEGNLRVPMIVRWPRFVEAGSVSDVPSVVCDLLPTLLDLAVASRKPSRTDGVSLLPLLAGREQPEHPLLYWETTAGESSAVNKGQIAQTGAWKCVRLPGSQQISLYNLDDDPAERVDVAARHPDVLDRLTR